MTQTDVDRRFITGCYDFLPNETLTDIIWENMQTVDSIKYTEEDRTFATALQETIGKEAIEARLSDIPEEIKREIKTHALYPEPIEPHGTDEIMSGSTDVGDMSWITPTAQFTAASWPVGTPPHTWQAVAANGDFGLKSVIFTAKVFAGTAYDLLTDPTAGANVQKEFNTATSNQAYESALPSDVTLPFDITL